MTRRSRPSGRAEPTLFERAARSAPGGAPLADRVRPHLLGEIAGHGALVADGKPLAQAIASDRLGSTILWGPPGCGKTTLAHVVAACTRSTFVPFSAVLGGVGDVRRIVAEARERRARGGGRTLLFVDEIHRFNKAQQDAFLPHVEDGTVTLIGATTENPSFSLIAPLLSRCTVYHLEPLDEEALARVLRRALTHPEGLDGRIQADDDAMLALVAMAGGDARRALNALELAVALADEAGVSRLTLTTVGRLASHRTLLYDRAGEEHHNVASAFIKSLRGSDPDAAVYWLMRMIEAGDDPLFVLRRMLVFASEDIGNADPRALQLAVAADQAFARLGLPEGIYPMAQAAIYLACAPKSNACTRAWQQAKECIDETGALGVPLALRNAPTALMRELGYGAGYRYPHDEAGAFAPGETYLPEPLVRRRFYHPTDRGLEQRIAAWLRKLRPETEEE